jgi:hypothetical protein
MGKFTRRELAAALSTSAVLLAHPQAQAPSAAAVSSPGEELKAARAQLMENAEQLDKFPLPMSAEPATIFQP